MLDKWMMIIDVKLPRYTQWKHLGGGGEEVCLIYDFGSGWAGERSASRPGRVLAPWKEPPVPIVQQAGCAPEPVWTQRLQDLTPPAFRPCSIVIII
jgi:hypothetical protein